MSPINEEMNEASGFRSRKVNLQDLNDWTEEDADNQEPIGYYCLGCNDDFDTPDWGHTCPTCGGSAIDAVWEY